MKISFTLCFRALIILAMPICPSAQTPYDNEYAFGADLSFVRQMEEQGKKFKDGGVVKPGLQIFRDNGYNWIRLRTCVEPARLPNDLKYTVAMARDAKKLGYKFLLDFHYSNGWADPTNEPTPQAWQKLTHQERVKALFEYTRDTIAALRDAGVLPDMVQIGNEVGNGILWPDGKLPENWDNFARYIAAGVKGVDAGRGSDKRPKIMIHVDHGGDIPKTKAFFDKFNSYKIPYDVMGFSFYPWSHGTLMDLRANFAFAANTYGKDIFLVETGYYWKPSKYFTTYPPPFPESPDGQRQWLTAVNNIVMQTPNGRGKGVFWWEPAAGSGLVDRGYFDNDGNALPVMTAFHYLTRPSQRVDGQ